MVRRRGKRIRRDVYSSNIQKYSVYPQPRHPEHEPKRASTGKIKRGDTINVRIIDIDDDGRGIGYYMGMKVIVEGVEPGIQVKVRVDKVEGDTIYGTVTF